MKTPNWAPSPPRVVQARMVPKTQNAKLATSWTRARWPADRSSGCDGSRVSSRFEAVGSGYPAKQALPAPAAEDREGGGERRSAIPDGRADDGNRSLL